MHKSNNYLMVLCLLSLLALIAIPASKDKIGAKFKAPFGFSCRINLTRKRPEFIVPQSKKPASVIAFRKAFKKHIGVVSGNRNLNALSKRQIGQLEKVIVSCQSKAKRLFTPSVTTPVAIVLPTIAHLIPTILPTAETVLPPNLCKDYSIFWNVGIPVNSSVDFSTESSPTIKRNQVFLVHEYFHAAIPFLTQNAEDASSARYFGKSVEQIGNYYYISGGIPQRADYVAHFATLDSSLDTYTASDYAGLVVIDFERWFPTSSEAWDNPEYNDPYKIASIAYAHATNSALSGNALIDKAKSQFQAAAINVFLQTVQHIKAKRPHAKVGVYDLLIHVYFNGYSSTNGDYLRRMNEKSLAIHKASDVIIADIYQFYPSYNNGLPAIFEGQTWYPPPDPTMGWYGPNESYVKDNISEAKRIAALAGGKQVIAYSWPRYHEGGSSPRALQLVSPADLFVQLLYPRELGADGAVIWGYEDPANQDFQVYINATIAPLIEQYCSFKKNGSLSWLFSRLSSFFNGIKLLP